MTVEVLIQRALEKHLLAMPNTLASAMENISFTPQDGVPYQRCAILRAAPESGDMGRKIIKEQGILQVVLLYPNGEGTVDARAQADAIKNWFKPPMTLTEGGINVLIAKPIQVATGFPLNDRFAVPVSVPWEAWIPS